MNDILYEYIIEYNRGGMMMKKINSFLLRVLFLCILGGCASTNDIEFAQQTLQEPDCIEVMNNSEILATYNKDSEEYMEIYNAIRQNWWKNAPEGYDCASDNSLVNVKNIKDIRTTSDMRYVTGEQIFVNFSYTEQSMQWNRSTGEKVKIIELIFVLPKNAEENRNVKGYFAATDTEDNISSEGIYTYYYSDELYNALSESGKTVTTEIHNVASKVDLSYFIDITIDDMQKVFLETYAWTHLIDHNVYWNSVSKQTVINYTFSEKASEKELSAARDYWNSIGIFRNRQNSDSNVNVVWSRIPQNAEVIIQVYIEENLIFQDIYGDIEKGIIYKEIHFQK